MDEPGWITPSAHSFEVGDVVTFDASLFPVPQWKRLWHWITGYRPPRTISATVTEVYQPPAPDHSDSE